MMADSTSAVDRVSVASRMSKDESLSDMLKDHRQIGINGWKDRWEKATRMQKFAGGNHWPDDSKTSNSNDKPQKSPRLSINEIAPVLQTFSGRQMMQRFERAYMPRHPAAARQGEIMTAVDRAMMHAADAEQVESAAFKDGPGIQGISCVRWELDTLGERGGGLLLTDVPIWQVMADPEARSINLSDRSWHRIGDWMSQSEVRERWDDKWSEIVNTMGAHSWSPKDATTSSRIPWAGMAGNKPLEPYYPKGRVFWVEYEEWREVKTYWEVGVPTDPSMTYADAIAASLQAAEGQPDAMSSQTFEKRSDLREFMDQHQARFNEEVPKSMIVTGRKLVYKYAYMIGDVIVETDDIPTGYWTVQFLTGFRCPSATSVDWQSLVERLVDPQKWVNVMLSALIRNIQITPKGLLFVEEGFFRNRNEAMAAWGSPGGLITVGRGKLSGGQPGYQFVAGGTQPYASMVGELMAFYREAIPRLAGFNPGALGQLGSDLRRISGEVVRQVQDAAMTSNAEPFDALRLHRREGGRIFLSFLRTFFEVEDIVRIVGEDTAYDEVLDPATGQPQVDPATGQPIPPQLVIPDKQMWAVDSWKEITVEDVVPTGDQLASLWKALETSIQILLTPQPDTGQPLFNSEDLAEIIPGIPAQRREKMLQRIRAAVIQMRQQQAQQPPGPPAGPQSAPAPPQPQPAAA